MSILGYSDNLNNINSLYINLPTWKRKMDCLIMEEFFTTFPRIILLMSEFLMMTIEYRPRKNI